MSSGKLAEELQHELKQLRQMAAVASVLTEVPPDKRQPWDAAAAAKYIADLTLGLENLWKRRSIHLGLLVPQGEDSHARILDAFLGDPSLGGSLPHETRQLLKKYLRFRHRLFHGYGHQVRWEIVEEPLRLLPKTVLELEEVWNEWLRKQS